MNRKTEISFANVVLCMLVIFIHITSAPVVGLRNGTLQHILFFVPWRLSAFVVQGFIFLSAVKVGMSKKTVGYIGYCISRLRAVIIPYLAAVVIFYIYFVRHGYFEFSFRDLVLYAVKGDLSSHFYFVIAIVQFYLLKPLWQWMIKAVPFWIAVVVSAVVMIGSKVALVNFNYADRLFTTYILYWVLGCYAGKNLDAAKVFLSRYTAAISAVFLGFAVINSVLSYVSRFNPINFNILENLHMLYALSAIAFVMCMGVRFGDKVMSIGALKKIDGASYYIYLIHPLIIISVNDYMARWGITSTEYTFAIRAITTYGLSIIICVIYNELKRKIGGLLWKSK